MVGDSVRLVTTRNEYLHITGIEVFGFRVRMRTTTKTTVRRGGSTTTTRSSGRSWRAATDRIKQGERLIAGQCLISKNNAHKACL